MTAPTLYRLVTLEEAKDHLSVIGNENDARIDRIVIEASQMIMDRIPRYSLKIDGWTDTNGTPLVYPNGDPVRVGALGSLDTAGNFVLTLDTNGNPIEAGISIIPGPVITATLLVIGNKDDDREGIRDPFSPAVESILARYCDPPV